MTLLSSFRNETQIGTIHQVRHPDQSALKRLQNHPLMLIRKLSSPLSVPVHDSMMGVSTGGKPPAALCLDRYGRGSVHNTVAVYVVFKPGVIIGKGRRWTFFLFLRQGRVSFFSWFLPCLSEIGTRIELIELSSPLWEGLLEVDDTHSFFVFVHRPSCQIAPLQL